MKLLADNDVAPICLMAGDVVTVHYEEMVDGKVVSRRDLVQAPVTKACTVDRVAVVGIETGDPIGALCGIAGGYAGVVGKRA